MIYLSHFDFPSQDTEDSFILSIKRTCYDTCYPFRVLSLKGLQMLDFEPITILYGGNGSGKSTALNVIAERLGLERDTLYNRSNFFGDYTERCHFKTVKQIPKCSRIVTSDDVFDFMLNLRSVNEGVNLERDRMFEDYQEYKYNKFKMTSLDDYDKLKKVNQARHMTQSKYVRANLMDNIREHSNGESAFLYFQEKIKENGLYLLDEPENSLSPERQMELLKFLEDSVRFFGCQFIMATHSPFLLSMNGAKIYDLDEQPVDVKRWTELKNVREYYEFFQAHEREFDV